MEMKGVNIKESACPSSQRENISPFMHFYLAFKRNISRSFFEIKILADLVLCTRKMKKTVSLNFTLSSLLSRGFYGTQYHPVPPVEKGLVCNIKGPICKDPTVEINSVPPVFLAWYGWYS
jgi:hypothetical protein